MELQMPAWLVPLVKITVYTVCGYLAVCIFYAQGVWGSVGALFSLPFQAPFMLFYLLVLNVFGAAFGRFTVSYGVPTRYAGAAFGAVVTAWLAAQDGSTYYQGTSWPDWVPWTFPAMLVAAWLRFYPEEA